MFWSCACFCVLAINNLALVIDLLVVKDIDLRIFRLLLSLAAVLTLLFGFIWADEED